MEKIILFLIAGACFMTGCASQTVQDAGVGMRLGSSVGTPLAPFALGAGIVTELAGKAMGTENQQPLPGSPEFERRGKVMTELLANGEVVARFKQRLEPSSETTGDQISSAAVSVCAEIDQMVSAKEVMKISKASVHPAAKVYLKEDVGEFYLVPVEKNPLGDKCVAGLENVGKRHVTQKSQAAAKKP